jgi:hypothetical protein
MYEEIATRLGEAIKAMDEEHINNFVSYLTQHFPVWMEKYSNTPEGLTEEFEMFANMNL